MFENKAHTKVEFVISTGTILKIIGVLVAFWFLYFIRDIIAVFFVAFILSSIIDPLADWFEVRKVPRAMAVVIVYVILISIMGLVLSQLIPVLVQEVRDLASNFSTVWDRLVSGAINFQAYSATNGVPQEIQQGLSSIQSTLTKVVGGMFDGVVSIFGGLVSFMLILVLTFYMVIQEDSLKRTFKVLIPDKYQSFAASTGNKVRKKIMAWVKGQLVLSFVVGLMVYIGLSILGVNYALVLGIFAALVELIPYVGPFLAATVAVFFAFAQSTTLAFFTVILFVVIQQLENNILVPKVMQKAVGLSPIISILALVVGVKIGGIAGALFSIPVATALDVIVREIIHGESEN